MNRILKRKRILMIIFSLMLLGVFFFIGTTDVYAEISGSIPVTYIKYESSTYPLNVRVTGNGEILSGSDTLRNQKKQYLLAVDETMTFEVKVDKRSMVKSIKLNDEDAMSKLKDNKITVEGAEKEQTLLISFEEISNSGVLPQTGDITQIGLYMVLVFISIVAGGYMYYRSKKN